MSSTPRDTRPGEVDGPRSDQRGEASHEELVMHLERDQLVAATAEPVPRAPLSRRAKVVLWALRVFVVLVSVMVVYTFVDRLH
jgi:hypothetical protein